MTVIGKFSQSKSWVFFVFELDGLIYSFTSVTGALFVYDSALKKYIDCYDQNLIKLAEDECKNHDAIAVDNIDIYIKKKIRESKLKKILSR